MSGISSEDTATWFSNGSQSGASNQGTNCGLERRMLSPFSAVGGNPGTTNGQEQQPARAGSGECPINGGKGPSYSKNQLLAIYDVMLWQTKGALPPPSDVQLPAILQRKAARIGWTELQADQWLYLDPRDGKVRGPASKTEILNLREVGSLSADPHVVPLMWFQANATPMKQMLQIWRDSERREFGKRGSGDSGMLWGGSQELGADAGLMHKGPGEVSRDFIAEKRKLTECDVQASQWLYKDREGLEQGPYPTSQLVDWWSQGFFDQQLMIRPEAWEGEPFVPMRKLLVFLHGDDEDWIYKDENSVLQGPFPKEQILSWWEEGYMPYNLPMRSSSSWEKQNEFLPLLHLIVKWTDVSDDWSYKDVTGVIHEHVPKTSILEMWKNGLLSSNLLVKPESWVGCDYIPLEHLMQAL